MFASWKLTSPRLLTVLTGNYCGLFCTKLVWDLINWIKSCINMTSLAILINETPIKFFQISRGLRQDYALSPLLFLIKTDGLSTRLTWAQESGKIIGCRIRNRVSLSHLIFLDNLLTIGKSNPSEWWVINNIILDFGNASGLQVSHPKSTLVSSDLESSEIMEVANIFGVKSTHMDDGLAYLGLFLIPNGWKNKYWD